MAKAPDLDTPFRTGETVLLGRAVRGAPEGAVGNVKLINGLDGYNGGKPWLRYWVNFSKHGLVGQVTHADLARPFQYGLWLDREEADAKAALHADEAAMETETTDAAETPAGDGGVASLIPADLLERSRAAKARLLGS